MHIKSCWSILSIFDDKYYMTKIGNSQVEIWEYFCVLYQRFRNLTLYPLTSISATGIIYVEVFETDIFEVANSLNPENPCYMCARMRRGHLYNKAQELGCNKIALGHHFDDVIETTVMNMLNAGSFQTMLPKLHSDNYNGMELIRPLYYVREKDIIAWKNYNDLSFLQCACKFTEAIDENEIYTSKRKETKELIRMLEKKDPGVVMNIFKSAFNINMNMILGYKDDLGYHSFLDEYECKGQKNG